MRYLEAPVTLSLDHFLLPDSDDRVRALREMLRGPVGRQTAEKEARASDFWVGAMKKDKQSGEMKMKKSADQAKHVFF